ncbi:MAG: GNAT family N-acetyltransferase [Patescibacteria group bacterium]
MEQVDLPKPGNLSERAGINTSIRPATREDIPTFIQLQKNDGFSHQYYLNRERLELLFDRGEQFFVATHEGKPVGFASVDCEQRATAHFLCVDKKHKRRGIGRLLMKTLIDETKKRGLSRLDSYVEANSSKEIFLEKNGFVLAGFYTNRYGNGQDASIWKIEW